MTTTVEAARRWAATWKAAWEALAADAVVAIYAADALVSTEPFREPHRGREALRDYVTRVFGEEEDPRVWVSEPIIDGDRASISWWASLREDGEDTTLAGTSVLRFDGDGLVAEQWDAWNAAEKHKEPPGWSIFVQRDT